MNIGGSEFLGFCFSLTSIISMISASSGGVLSDIMGRKSLSILGIMSLTLGSFVIYTNPSSKTPTLIGVLLILALPSIAGGTLVAILTELVPSRIIGKLMSLSPVITLVSMSCGSAALGYITNTRGLKYSLTIVIILTLLVAISCFFLIETRRGTNSKQKRSVFQGLTHLKELFLERTLALIAAPALIEGFITKPSSTYLSTYLSNIGFTEKAIGFLYSIFPIVQAVGQPISGAFVDSYSEKKALLLNASIAACAVALFTILSVTSPSISPYPLIVSSFIAAFGNTGMLTYIAKAIPESKRATAYSSITVLQKISGIPAPIIGAILWNLRPQLIFIFICLFNLMKIPLILLLKGISYVGEK